MVRKISQKRFGNGSISSSGSGILLTNDIQMKIFLDIGHPAHVHYFRNLIALMLDKGHEFFVSARDKEVSLKLLEKYNINYYNRGKGSADLSGKALYLLRTDLDLLSRARSFKPDLFLSFASPYAAHVAKILGKPHIGFTDTENAKLGILSFAPFTECIVTPAAFARDFKSKHVRFEGFMELCYLNPDYFTPDNKVCDEIGMQEGERFIFLRFVSWGANHDIGQAGIADDMKILLVRELSKKARVLISSEGKMPAELSEFKIKVSPEKIHNVLAFASLYIGEGATMASECAMLGTPAIYVNTLSAGTIEKQEEYGLLFRPDSFDAILKTANSILDNHDSASTFTSRRSSMLTDQIDVTAFMVWFVENYPESFAIMKTDPHYQDRFKLSTSVS
jgi:uncharacterized protein